MSLNNHSNIEKIFSEFFGNYDNLTPGSGVQKQVCWPLFYAALITNDCLYTDQKSYNYKFSASELQRDSENKSCSITMNASIYYSYDLPCSSLQIKLSSSTAPSYLFLKLHHNHLDLNPRTSNSYTGKSDW